MQHHEVGFALFYDQTGNVKLLFNAGASVWEGNVSPGLVTPTLVLYNQIAVSTTELTPPQMNEENIAPNILITSPAAVVVLM